MGVRGMRESGAKKRFGGTIVRGGVKRSNAESEGTVNYGIRGKEKGIRVVLSVEGCGPAY